jgi:hypothetical protein
VGARLGVLSALRQCADFGFSEQQPAGGFLLRVVQRGVRAEEPEGQVWHAGGRRRVQDQVRAAGREQQSEPVVDELRAGKREFALDEVYAFERHLGELYPGNQNVRPKIRQQLQYLRNRGFVDFVSRGNYRLRT